MSHKHDTLLQAIFHDPLPANVHWRELESLLNHLGAHLEPSHGARFKVTLHEVIDFVHHPHNNGACSRDLLKQVREFLTKAGVNPGKGP